MAGKNFALVSLEILQLFTKNELEVNETKQRTLKTGVPCLPERGKCFNTLLVKTFHQEVGKMKDF